MTAVTKEELCSLLGVLPGNALVEDIWEKMKTAGWQIVSGGYEVMETKFVGTWLEDIRMHPSFPWWDKTLGKW
jgi:hypothetical protein